MMLTLQSLGETRWYQTCRHMPTCGVSLVLLEIGPLIMAHVVLAAILDAQHALWVCPVHHHDSCINDLLCHMFKS